MNLSAYLDSQPAGYRASFAREVGISPAYLYQIERGIRPAPVDRVIEFAQATGWKVTPNAIRPDIYRHPEDGLPAELRGLKKETA